MVIQKDNIRMFVVLDPHKKYIEVAVVDNGVVSKQKKIENKPELIEELSNKLSSADKVLELSSTWYWFMKYCLGVYDKTR